MVSWIVLWQVIQQSTNDKVFELIYAMGSTNPGSSAVDARLIQHVDNGVIRIDLSKSISSSGTTSSSDGSGESTATPVSTSSLDDPFLPYQRIIIAHAVMCGLGFLIFLPLGALLARYMRTFVAGPIWFRSHAILQFAIGKTTIDFCSLEELIFPQRGQWFSPASFWVSLLSINLVRCIWMIRTKFVHTDSEFASRLIKQLSAIRHCIIRSISVPMHPWRAHPLGEESETNTTTTTKLCSCSCRTSYYCPCWLPSSFGLWRRMANDDRARQRPTRSEYLLLDLDSSMYIFPLWIQTLIFVGVDCCLRRWAGFPS